jgi:uncharacterized delta-60 repeat protein
MARNTTRSRITLESLESRRLLSAGGLDPTFGGGIIGNPFGFDARDVAVQSNGKVVLVGTRNSDFAVGRLNSNGSIDTSFGGGDGLVTTNLGAQNYEMAQQVVIQPNGQILVAGMLKNQALSMESQWGLARYNADGSPDGSFGAGGKETVLGFNLTSGITDLALQSDGKILFTSDYGHHGGIFSSDNYDFALVRLQSNGALDSHFGDQANVGRKGYVITGFGDDDFAMALAIQNGKIVVGGSSGDFGGGKLALARYNPDGTLDKTFDHDGKVTTDLIASAQIHALAVTNGKIIAAATSNSNNVVTLERYNYDGSLDQFGNGGYFTQINHASGAEIPDSVIIPQPGKILVVGHLEYSIHTGRKPQFFALQLSNDARDQSFGNNGVAVFDAKTSYVATPAAQLTNDGKVVVAGGQTALRFVEATPTIRILATTYASETPGNDGMVQFTRDVAYNFPTRVYFKTSGTATPGVDFTGPINYQPSVYPVRVLARTIGFGPGLGVLFQPAGYVDIPAGQYFAQVPVHIVDDSQLELPETLTVTAQPDAAYTIARPASTITINDNDHFMINFQADDGSGPNPNFAPDFGKTFADRGNGYSYGWDADNTANARIRHNSQSPDFTYDSFNHLQKNGANRKWEIALPNGLYQVTLAAGDPNAIDSNYKLNLENTLALAGAPTNNTHWFKRTINVQVSDGRLTLSNAAGAINNKIDWIDIKSAPSGSVAGPVTDNTPVNLLPLIIVPPFKIKDGLFSKTLLQ